VSRLFGIQRSSVRLFVNGVEIPSQNIFNLPNPFTGSRDRQI